MNTDKCTDDEHQARHKSHRPEGGMAHPCWRDLVLDCKNKRYIRWPFRQLALLLARHSPLRGCSSLAPRQPPKWPAGYIAYFCNQALGLEVCVGERRERRIWSGGLCRRKRLPRRKFQPPHGRSLP